MSRPIIIPVVVNVAAVLGRANMTLGLTNGELAELTGSSVRTVIRWYGGQSHPGQDVFQKLAVAAFPKDAALAADLATAGGVTLEQLGLVQKQRVPVVAAPPPPPPIPTSLLAEAVVCSAAEELDAPPRAVRGILRAAFRRAREMRLTVESMDDALSLPSPATPPQPGRAKESKA